MSLKGPCTALLGPAQGRPGLPSRGGRAGGAGVPPPARPPRLQQASPWSSACSYGAPAGGRRLGLRPQNRTRVAALREDLGGGGEGRAGLGRAPCTGLTQATARVLGDWGRELARGPMCACPSPVGGRGALGHAGSPRAAGGALAWRRWGPFWGVRAGHSPPGRSGGWKGVLRRAGFRGLLRPSTDPRVSGPRAFAGLRAAPPEGFLPR